MDKPAKKKGPTKAQLARQVFELKAQLVHVYHFADATLNKAGNFGGSAVILQLSTLGGTEVIPPVAIKGGLSQKTIDAIREDLQRSYIDSTMFKPKGVS